MTGDTIEIKFSSKTEKQEIDLTVAEIGVLLTAVNRSFNKLVITTLHPLQQHTVPTYDVINSEPPFVVLKISSIRKGSIELQVIADCLTDIGLDPTSAKAVILGILANAISDTQRIKIIAADMKRAMRRVSQLSRGKVITLAIKAKNKVVRLCASVSENGDVQIDTQTDDTQ